MNDAINLAKDHLSSKAISVRNTYLLLIFISISEGYGQALTGIIKFDELIVHKVERILRWPGAAGKQEQLDIIELPIPITETIRRMTLDFEQRNYHYNSVWLTPRFVVVHSMDLDDLKNSLQKSSLLHDRIPSSWGLLSKAGSLPNGAHFIIDKDGTIYCLTPPFAKDGKAVSYERTNHQWFIRRHQDANPLAIGIENVTPANGDFTDLSEAQISANAQLIRWLVWFENGQIRKITSHHQYNDEQFLDCILGTENLRHQLKPYRTTGRKDVGSEVLSRIIEKVGK